MPGLVSSRLAPRDTWDVLCSPPPEGTRASYAQCLAPASFLSFRGKGKESPAFSFLRTRQISTRARARKLFFVALFNRTTDNIAKRGMSSPRVFNAPFQADSSPSRVPFPRAFSSLLPLASPHLVRNNYENLSIVHIGGDRAFMHFQQRDAPSPAL